jgi:hypothetical protein
MNHYIGQWYTINGNLNWGITNPAFPIWIVYLSEAN